MKNEDITDPVFRDAVNAIDNGDIVTLQYLLETTPELVTKPLNTPGEEGYFKDPYLLWFIADNPIRHEKLPTNIVDITRVILMSLRKNNVANYQYQVDYTLGLVSTGRIPKECHVQVPLMELLIDAGARVNGSVLGPIGQHNFEAARYLLDKGAAFNLATAVGLDKKDDVNNLIHKATASELYVALVVASFFGKADLISLLIDAGVDVNGKGNPTDFGGFHAHATALHQAVYSGSLECVKLLVNAGANLEATDEAYHGTPLGWALHMKEVEASNDEEKKKFANIETFLRMYNSDI